ncbi:DUF2958 domain-containing protein [Ferrovibrio sp.]|uniref:DUF2958 domain-containing protein n=1 Tax=Ferrovibrio sp. TaxID=1917215 RepID=UPI001BC139F7|nr:DUF2958 domain-containing protein [Ferrovibrio sp.]MBS4047004.1 DUF2958 domain-containing protein [Alphaproteobacteria bacterium]
MTLIPDSLRAQLLANGAVSDETDHWPVVKFFNPTGAATWLLTELAADGDTLFGLCDLGFGCPELGYVSLREIAGIRVGFGLRIERDRHFKAGYPLSVYAEAARRHGAITEADHLLREADAALNHTKSLER